MIKLSNSLLISTISKLLILLVVAKSLSLGLWWYLPNDGIEIKEKYNYQPTYQRVVFNNMIIQEKKIVKEIPKKVTDSINITNMILKGIYGTNKKAFVIVAMKSSAKKTEVIGIGEIFKGYKLKSITISSAIFEKNSKDYVLLLEERKGKKGSKSISNSYITKVARTSSLRGSSINYDKPVGVSRKDIAYFAKNPKQIWREISIKELRDGKKIIGFKIRKINKNSKFAMLGLQKGDLITMANNIKLESYKDAIDIYNKIDKLDTIQIVVMRNNQEVELVYEIN
ncbi:MAG: hypothetical protein U9P72_10385 [Campylobacterota bacterium]|nr:hypothetical protein [Campylobacterota bacterium]